MNVIRTPRKRGVKRIGTVVAAAVAVTTFAGAALMAQTASAATYPTARSCDNSVFTPRSGGGRVGRFLMTSVIPLRAPSCKTTDDVHDQGVKCPPVDASDPTASCVLTFT